MSVNRNFPVVRDTWLAGTAAGSGNGKGSYLLVGQSLNSNRSLLAIDCDFTGALSVNRAALSIVVSGGCSISMGSAPKFYVERVPSGYGAGKEGDFAEDCNYNTNNATVWPGPTAVTANRAFWAGSPAENTRVESVITAMMEAFRVERAAAGQLTGTLVVRLIAANATANGYEESNAARYIAVHSIQGVVAQRPRVETVLGDNRPPGFPAYGLSYVGGDRVEWRLTANDPDTDDYMTASESEYWTENTQDNDQSQILGGTGNRVAPHTAVLNHYFSGVKLRTIERTDLGFTSGMNLRVRFRTRDKANVWGIWGRLRDPVRFNWPPRAPRNLTVSLDSTTPDYGGDLNPAEPGEQFSGVEVQVRKVTAQGVRLLMNATTEQLNDDGTTISGTGMVAVPGGTTFLVTHNGEALVFGEEYERRLRAVDQWDARGPFSGWLKFTPRELGRPTFIPESGVRQDSLTPLVGARYSETFSGIRIRIYRAAEGTDLLWEAPEETVTATTSYTRAYGSTGTAVPLAWAQRVWGETEVRVVSSGAWTPISDRVEMRLNALSRGVATQVEGAVTSLLDGALVVTIKTPRLILPRDDPDEPGDPATRRIVEIWDAGASAPRHVQNITSGITGYYDVPTGAFNSAWEKVHLVRHRYADQSGELGRWGEFVTVRTSQPPTLTAGGGAADPNPDPTPTLTATFASPSGKAQLRREWPIYLGTPSAVGDEVFRGVVEGPGDSYFVPRDVLLDATAYVVIPIAWDVDGLSASLSSLGGSAISLGASTANINVAVTTGALQVNVATASPADTFTRTVTDGWGTADVGGDWTLT